jgi:hypothetical protein
LEKKFKSLYIIFQNTHPEYCKKYKSAKTIKRSAPSASSSGFKMEIPGPKYSTVQKKLDDRLSFATVSQETVNQLIVD